MSCQRSKQKLRNWKLISRKLKKFNRQLMHCCRRKAALNFKILLYCESFEYVNLLVHHHIIFSSNKIVNPSPKFHYFFAFYFFATRGLVCGAKKFKAFGMSPSTLINNWVNQLSKERERERTIRFNYSTNYEIHDILKNLEKFPYEIFLRKNCQVCHGFNL